MTPLLLSTILKNAADAIDEDMENGNCLNFAVAAQSALQKIGINTEILKVMRSVTFEDSEETDDYGEHLSHIVLYWNPKHTNFYDEDLTFDHQGKSASGNWARDWNQVQMEIREPEEDFWVEEITMPINEFLTHAQEEYGSIQEDKLVDKPELRNVIESTILDLPIIKEYLARQKSKENELTM